MLQAVKKINYKHLIEAAKAAAAASTPWHLLLFPFLPLRLNGAFYNLNIVCSKEQINIF